MLVMPEQANEPRLAEKGLLDSLSDREIERDKRERVKETFVDAITS